MNNYAIAGISFAIGAAAAGVSTYIIMKKRCEAEINRQIAEFKEEYRAAGDRKPYFAELDAGEVNPVGEVNRETNPLDVGSSLDDGVDIPLEKVEYHKMASNYKKQLDKVLAEKESPSEADDGKEGTADSEAKESPKIYLLDAEEFNHSQYDPVNLIYYAHEELLYEGDEEIERPDILVGDCLSSLDIPEGEEGVIYIRNEDFGVDYEIDVLWDRYDTNDE